MANKSNQRPPHPPVPAKKPTTTGTTTAAQRNNAKQEAMRRRQQQKMRNQMLGVAGGIVVLAVVVIVTVLFLSTPTSFVNLPETATYDVELATIGSADAKVTLVEYGDVRCIACDNYFKAYEPTIKNTYVKTGLIKYTFQHYNVIDSMFKDGDSARASEAIDCAGDQRRSWDYRDALFANYVGEESGKLTAKYLKDMAKALNLNTDQFNSCLDSGKFKSAVASDNAEAGKLGINSTPSFVLKYAGKTEVLSLQAFTDINTKIDAALKAVGVNK